MTAISTASVAELHAIATAEHEAFSIVHAKHVEAEADLGKAAGIRSRLVRDLDGARRALSDARRVAIGAAIDGAGFEEASARVAALQNEAKLLDLSLREYHAYQYMDAQRAALAAKVTMLEKQHSSERARLNHKVASLQLGLSAVAAQNGGSLNVEMAGAVRGFEELIARIGREADGAREALKNHDAETRALRSEVGEA
jgi:hypothetical protein